MRNLAGNSSSTATDLCIAELKAAGITVVDIEQGTSGEVRSKVTGTLGPFTFERYWCYWVVRGRMSYEHAQAINTAKRPIPRRCQGGWRVAGRRFPTVDHALAWMGRHGRPVCRSKYSGYESTWGDVIRVEGFAGGTKVDPWGCSSWHVDTADGLAYFAAKVREFGLDTPRA